MSEHTQNLIIGVGNPFRGDDKIGLIVARRMQMFFPNELKVLELSGDGTALITAWKNAENVILIDCAVSRARIGAIHRFDALREDIGQRLYHDSTHALGVPEAIAMSRTLGQLPKSLTVYTVTGHRFGLGERMSPEVSEAIHTVQKLVLDEIHTWAEAPAEVGGAT